MLRSIASAIGVANLPLQCNACTIAYPIGRQFLDADPSV
jgi:hypothetical protein